MDTTRPAVVPNNNYNHDNIVRLLKELLVLKKSNLDLNIVEVKKQSSVGVIYQEGREIHFFIEHNIIYLSKKAEVMLDILERSGVPCDFNEELFISKGTLRLWEEVSDDL